MIKILLLLSFFILVACQTKHNNGNPTGEIGAPAFDEIVVHSTLTVRGKSASRASKALVSDSKPKTIPLLNTNTTTTTTTTTTTSTTASPGAAEVTRNKRAPRGRYGGYQGSGGFGGFPSSSSSSSQASSNAFNQNTPFGSFGGSASQTASQSQSFGPHGFKAAAGQSASQSYHLPNGNQIDVSFSSSYNAGKGGPNFSNSHAVTLTRPNGQTYQLGRRR